MKNKIIGILVVTLLIGTAYSSLGLEENTSSSLNNSIEVEDQHNPYKDYVFLFNGSGMDYMNYKLAQGFTPAHTPLTKVTLQIHQDGNPPENTNLTVSIRDNLDGDDIVSNTINLDDVSSPGVDFVFPDTDLTIGMMYYFVCIVDKGGFTEDDGYYWGASIYDTYENGDCWEYLGGHWIEGLWQGIPVDFAFSTYWRDYAPDACEIDGPTEGKAQEFTDYTFCTTDPEGHDVRYYIEWGDGIDFKWIGPYESGEIVTKGHSWASKDNYTIRVKARDIYGAEGDWTELEVSMPKVKATASPFLRFLENHPRLFPLIRQMLGL